MPAPEVRFVTAVTAATADYHRNHGRRTKKLGSLKKAANVKIYIIFDVFGFCGRGTKVDFKDWADFLPPPPTNSQPDCKIFLTTSLRQLQN